MLDTIHSFLVWRLGQRSTILGWISVFVGQFLLGGLVMAGLLTVLGAPMNLVSGYAIAMFGIGAGLSGVVLALAWAGTALGASSVALGSLWGVWPASPSWWSEAARQWNAGSSIPGLVIAVLLVLPIVFCAASFGLNKLFEKPAIAALGRIREQRALNAQAVQADGPEGEVTAEEMAHIMRQKTRHDDGLLVTDRPSIVSSGDGDGSPAADTGAGDTGTGSLYDGLDSGSGNARLAGLGEAASNSRQTVGPDGVVRLTPDGASSVKGLVPERFGGAKSKRELPKEERNKLRLMAQTYMLEVDNELDKVSALEGYIEHFGKQLMGLTDEHFSYLKTLTDGNGQGVIEVARAQQNASLTVKTDFEKSVDQTAGIDTLDATKIRRASDTASEEPQPEKSAAQSENEKALEEAAQRGGGSRITSLLNAAKELMDQASEPGSQSSEPSAASPGNAAPKQEAGKMTNDASSAPEREEPTSVEDILKMTGAGEEPEGGDAKAAPPAPHQGGFPPREEDSSDEEPPTPKAPAESESKNGVLGFADATQNNSDTSNDGSTNEEPRNVNTPSQPDDSTALTSEHCYKLAGLIEGVGSDVEIRHKIEQYAESLGVRLTDLLGSDAMKQTFHEGKCLQIKNRVQSLMRATEGSSFGEVNRSLQSAQHRVAELENSPHRLSEEALNQLETQVSKARDALDVMNPDNLEVVNAAVLAVVLGDRIGELRGLLASNSVQPKEEEVTPEQFDRTVSVLDRAIKANRSASAVPAAKPAVSSAASPAASLQPQHAATEVVKASPLAQHEDACVGYPDLMAVVEMARAGGAWHQHEALGDVSADPFLEPIPEGSDVVAQRQKQGVLLQLRLAAKPLVEKERAHAEEEARRSSQLTELRQERERVAQEKEELRREHEAYERERQDLEARERALVVNEQRAAKIEGRLDQYADQLDNFEILNRELNVSFSAMKPPKRFARFESDFAKLQLISDLFSRTANVALNGMQMIVEDDVPDHHRPHVIARNAMDAGFMARSYEILNLLCEEFKVPWDGQSEANLLGKLTDADEIAFVKSVFEYYRRGKAGTDLSRQWIQQSKLDAELAQKGRSVEAEDFDALRGRTIELDEKAKDLERELTEVRRLLSVSEQEVARLKEMPENALNFIPELEGKDLTNVKYDDRDLILRSELLFVLQGYSRSDPDCYYDVNGTRVYIGLPRPDQYHEPSLKRTIKALSSEQAPAVIFTNVRELDFAVPESMEILEMSSAKIKDWLSI